MLIFTFLRKKKVFVFFLQSVTLLYTSCAAERSGEKMRKRFFMAVMLICGAFCFARPNVFLKEKKADLYSSYKWYGRSVAKIGYGTELVVLEENGSWLHVQMRGKDVEGWINVSKVTERKITTSSSADAKEIALAGKGFSEEVENLYSQSGKGDFSAVDRIERRVTDLGELDSFIAEGSLKGGSR